MDGDAELQTLLAGGGIRSVFHPIYEIGPDRGGTLWAIEALARGPWATAERTHTTWYQPLEDQADIDRAVHWALGLPWIHINTVGDLALLPTVLAAADRFERRPADEAMAAMLQASRMTSLFGLPT